MKKISTKAPITLFVIFFFALVLGAASPVMAFTNQEIADAVTMLLDAGYSNAEIAAIASSYDVSAADISSAVEEVYGVDVSAAAEQAYAEVVTVEVNGTDYYTTVGESATVYTTPTTDGVNSIGTFDTTTGQFTATDGTTANLTDITGDVTVSVTNTGGTVITTINGQSWDIVVGDTVAGYTYLSCIAGGTSAASCWASYGSNLLNTTLALSTALLPTFTTPLTASNTSLPAGGGTVTLTWATVNTTSCTASGGWSGTKATSGSETIRNIASTATYVLDCQ